MSVTFIGRYSSLSAIIILASHSGFTLWNVSARKITMSPSASLLLHICRHALVVAVQGAGL
ncbi:hypothetical protein X961_4709 [Burkholderia pseudomallei MSHR5613]|nr:hypothetical protein X961_4709 [Burkholderia pseudomallei MSHR5613]KGS55886.1 hypothetical protein X949_4787 [Burkholderia pseudomallei MSHR5609]KGS87110.1 hypothetical protein X976_3984 [Burkholderia pseudomallei MSHR7500]KGX56399.1 hypothetical protein Y024_4630 [Burkholderia pseudomallei TSV44]